MNLRRQMLRRQLHNGTLSPARYAASFRHPPATREIMRTVFGQGKPKARIYERSYHPTKGWRETRA